MGVFLEGAFSHEFFSVYKYVQVHKKSVSVGFILTYIK